MANGSEKRLSAVKAALLSSELRQRADDMHVLESEPIAIVGSACRLPGGIHSNEQLWDLLNRGGDAISEVPAERWDREAYFDSDPATPGKINSICGGFLKDIDMFDARAFGIAPSEARYMDPQHRLLLEVAWEAFDDAGSPLESLRGSKTAVFFGVCKSDYGRMQLNHERKITAHTVSGTAPAIAAGRLSYLFDLRGPSVIIDTACSSSLVAVHMAVQSLRARDSDMALAGGVSLNLTPEETISLAKWGVLSPDGRCMTFDQRANGFVRSEGCGLVVLKRLSDALRSGDKVRAVIRATAINQDGRSNVLTAPNGEAQRELIREALEKAGMSGADVSYVETHGTGTKVGDPIEVESLLDTLGQPRNFGDVCYLGAVKANLGHLEAAAGVAGLIKIILCMQHNSIPPQVHFRNLNPLISLENSSLRIPQAVVPWESSKKSRVAGVSSFGFSGTNAHVIVEEPPKIPVASPAENSHKVPVVLPVSAKQATGLAQLLDRYSDRLATVDSRAELDSVAYTAANRRSHFEYRAAVVGEDTAELRQNIGQLLASGKLAKKLGDARLGFVFSGQGCGWSGMARSLFESEPTFAAAIGDCDREIESIAGWSIIAELMAEEGESRLHRTAFFQPALFAIQVALVALWDSWGIRPHAVSGHSVGEIAAAHTAGIMSLGDALRVVELRARLMQQASGQGAMAAVGLSIEELRARISAHEGLTAAASNGPESSTVSGEPAALDRFLDSINEDDIFARRLDVDCAFHSEQMDRCVEPLVSGLADIEFSPSKTAFYSTVTGTQAGARGDVLGATYWGRNLRQPVLFYPAVAAMIEAGCTGFVEIGPHPVLSAYLAGIGDRPDEIRPVFASMRRDQQCTRVMREGLAGLYAHGCDPEWSRVVPTAALASLPPYPWQREKCWLDWSTSRYDEQRIEAARVHPLLGRRIDSPVFAQEIFENRLATGNPAYLNDHRIGGVCLLPAAAMIEMVLAAGTHVGLTDPGVGRHKSGASIRDFCVENALIIPDESSVRVQLVASDIDDGKRMEIYSQAEGADTWMLHASATCHPISQSDLPSDVAPPPDQMEPNLDAASIYAEGRKVGIEFGASFRSLQRISAAPGRAHASIRLPADLAPEVGSHGLHPIVIDGCLQAVNAALLGDDRSLPLLLPIAVEQIDVFGPASGKIRATATLDDAKQVIDENTVVDASIRIFDDTGTTIALLRRVRLKVAGAAVLRRFQQDSRLSGLRNSNYWDLDVGWRPRPVEPSSITAGDGRSMIVCTNEPEFAAALAQDGQAQEAHRATRILCPADATAEIPNDPIAIDPYSLQSFSDALGHACDRSGGGPPRSRLDVVFVWNHSQARRTPSSICTESSANAGESAAALFHLLQALVKSEEVGPTRVLIVSRSAHAIEALRETYPDQAMLWGIGATVQSEHPELNCVMLDLDRDSSVGADAHIIRSEIADVQPGEDRIAYRGGVRHVARLISPASDEAADSAGMPFRLCATGTGVLEDVCRTGLERASPGPGQVEIETLAVGINFRDVLNVLNEVQGPDGANLGAECAGRVVAVGKGVDDLVPGDRVFALAFGGLASHVTVPRELIARVPSALDSVEAAGVPVVFLTVKYALDRVASLRAGQRVLIHSAAGGVGLAALQYARMIGASVIATAGSAQKRRLLRQLGVARVFDSRRTDYSDEIMHATDGSGVDVVLNSLAGEHIPASLAVVSRGGHFVELGKRDDWDADRVTAEYPEVLYRRIDLTDLAARDPVAISEMFAGICADFEAGRLRALPTAVYPVERASDAFKFMAQGRHIGKIVLPVQRRMDRPDFSIDSDAGYLITGGLGALGLQLAERLVAEGARTIVLLGRTAADESAQSGIDRMRRKGVAIVVELADVADFDSMSALFARIDASLPSLRGVFHCAGVLQDAAFSRQRWDAFRLTMQPKVDGAWNLHRLTRNRRLDFFVMFSSAAAVLGWPGQTNYAAANAFMDSLACYRAARGLPALSIDWGAWGGAGMAGRVMKSGADPFAERGLLPIDEREGLDALFRLLGSNASQRLIGRFDWNRFSGRYSDHVIPGFLDDVLQTPGGSKATVASTPDPEQRSIIAELERTPPAQKMRVLTRYVENQAAIVLGLADGQRVDRKISLNQQGLDSLLAVELRNALAAALETSLPASLLFDYPSINVLSRHLADSALNLAARDDEQAKRSEETDDGVDETAMAIAVMSDSEAEELLLRELNELRGAAGGQS